MMYMTEAEYKEKIKNWAERLRKDTMKMVTYLYPEVMKVMKEMEEVVNID